MKMAIVLGLAEVARELAQRLAHQPGLEADVAVAHLALDLGPWREGSHRVDDEHVDGARTHEHVGDLECLLAGVGLGDEQLVDVDTDRLGVHRIHGVLGVDVGARAAVALRLGDDVHRQGGLARRLGPVDLGDPAPRQAADAECQVERQGARGDRLDVHRRALAHAHDGALAELLVDLRQSEVEGLLAIGAHGVCLSVARDVDDVGDGTEGV